MSKDVSITFRITFPVIAFFVGALHLLVLLLNPFSIKLPEFAETQPPSPLKIRSIETPGEQKVRSDIPIFTGNPLASDPTKLKYGTSKETINNIAENPVKEMSLSDLAVEKKVSEVPPPRPGTRPEVTAKALPTRKLLNLNSNEIKQVAQSGGELLQGDPTAQGIDQSDVLVNIEVPEGKNPDELNEADLKYYGFARRASIKLINTYVKNLKSFRLKNPHLEFPMTQDRQTMTGRLTYDEFGNLKQIKMIRWSNVDRLQEFFEIFMKDMDGLSNPPKELLSKEGELTLFYTLVING